MSETYSTGEAVGQYLEVGMTEDIRAALQQAPIFQKNPDLRINIQISAGGEVVKTILDDGFEETDNITQPGDGIVTNPRGERHIVGASKLQDVYEHVEDDVWRPIGIVRAMPNPTGQHVVVRASWGERRGKPNCIFAAQCDNEAPEDPEKIGKSLRLIGAEEFDASYVPYRRIKQ